MAGNVQENVILGSGDLYITQYDESIDLETAAFFKTIEVETNKVGHIQGGAEIQYTPTLKEVVDDLGNILKRKITAETVTFKSGLLSVALEWLNRLVATGELTEDTTNHLKILKIGGSKRYNATAYLVHFVHTLDDGRKVRVTILGNSSNGFTMAFKADNETVVDAEYKALSQKDGTLVIFSEETQLPTERA